MKVLKELSESHQGMIHEAIKIAQALNPSAEFSDAQADGMPD